MPCYPSRSEVEFLWGGGGGVNSHNHIEPNCSWGCVELYWGCGWSFDNLQKKNNVFEACVIPFMPKIPLSTILGSWRSSDQFLARAAALHSVAMNYLYFLLFWLHEISLTTWVFEAYVDKSICWLVYSSDYMSSYWLHGFFARIYRNQTPFSVHLEFDYMRSFWLHELFACVYWNQTPFLVYLWLHNMRSFTLFHMFLLERSFSGI